MKQATLDAAIANRQAHSAAQRRFDGWTAADQKALDGGLSVRAPAFLKIQAIAIADCKAEMDALDTAFGAL